MLKRVVLFFWILNLLWVNFFQFEHVFKQNNKNLLEDINLPHILPLCSVWISTHFSGLDHFILFYFVNHAATFYQDFGNCEIFLKNIICFYVLTGYRIKEKIVLRMTNRSWLNCDRAYIGKASSCMKGKMRCYLVVASAPFTLKHFLMIMHFVNLTVQYYQSYQRVCKATLFVVSIANSILLWFYWFWYVVDTKVTKWR